MILPAKHIKFSQSILGFGGFILSRLKKPMTIDEIWDKYKRTSKRTYPGYHDFDNLVLAINLLYMMDCITLDDTGNISNALN